MRLLLALIIMPLCANAQSKTDGIPFVMPHGTGKVDVRLNSGFKPQAISLYDEGTRPVIGIVNDKTGIDVSYILFPNDTEAPTAESCRDAVVNVILKSMAGGATIENEVRASRTLQAGRTIATASYFVAKMHDMPIRQQELFGFYGDKNTCAEIHISKALAKPSDSKLFDVELERFAYTPVYVPTTQDYGAMANLLFGTKDTKAAAFYYKAAIASYDGKPMAGYDEKTMHRFFVDQLSMSYGMAGDLKRSRAVNEAAIAKDPDYPLYYYNLACADAEAGDAAAAKVHLQQAYDRRKNVIKGEKLPDASKDDSFLKLKGDRDFWAFVQALPKG